jgi:hypothetical protein
MVRYKVAERKWRFLLKDFRATCQLVGLLIKFFDLSSFVDCPLEPCCFQIMYRALIRVLNPLRELEVGLQILVRIFYEQSPQRGTFSFDWKCS